MPLIWILLIIAAVIAGWLAFWTLVSFLNNRSANHRRFLTGSIPADAPDGFYAGAAHIFFDRPTPWLGKSFAAADRLGFNIFRPAGGSLLRVLFPFYRKFGIADDGRALAFYFRTRTDDGLKDPGLKVVKLDYDAPENPFPIRIILDEIVECAPGEYLGKIHLKVFPGFYSTIGFFGLKKPV
ncbi:MAG: hypothetical protein JSS81_19340 [Acidobacteria bacterium]|nr:hypothetical protein [Acidobacteriota bacterium]